MKTIFFLLVVVFATASCKNNDGDLIKSFIPGTYIHFSDGEYSKSWDTLEITPYDEGRKTYLVNRRVGFQKIRKGRLQPKEHVKSRFVVVFHPTTYQLQNPSTGNLYTFLPETKSVLVGSALYNKIE